MKKLRPTMVELLNLRLEVDKSCLRYRERHSDSKTITYELVVKDRYVNDEYVHSIDFTKEFEEMVRGFFKKYEVTNIGYSNTVGTLIAWKEEE